MTLFRLFYAFLFLGLAACASPPKDAAPIPSVAEVLAKTKFWDFDAKIGPVYFGTIHRYDPKGRYSDATIDDCLAITFIKAEGDRIHYIHKLWEPDNKGQSTGVDCQFGNLKEMVPEDKDLGKPECFDEATGTTGTRALTPDAFSKIDLAGTYSRQLDVTHALAGFIEPCTVDQAGAIKDFLRRLGLTSANVFEFEYQGNELLMHTNPLLGIEWLYKINLNYIDVYDPNAEYPSGTGL